MKAQRAEEKKKLREEKANLRAQQQLQKRQETAELKQRHANLQISGIKGKYGLDPKSQYEALKFVQKQTEAFAQGNITSQRMNASIRERITLLRREAAAAQRATQAQGGAYVQAAKKEKLRMVKKNTALPDCKVLQWDLGACLPQETLRHVSSKQGMRILN
ncbi:hypothetical protein LOF14_00905 [Klebsiella variicola subsp. variicola]|nr:hypothetical protein LOF14_00905 [Klebsiella variicola subsp. variicola]